MLNDTDGSYDVKKFKKIKKRNITKELKWIRLLKKYKQRIDIFI